MAERTRFATQPQIPEPHPLPDQWNEATAGAVRDHVLRVVKQLNGYISLGDGTTGSWSGNLDAQYVDLVFPSTPDTEVKIPHGLKRVPVGYAIVRRDRACQVYDSSTGSWGESLFYLKCDTASATVKVLLW